jgi:transposase
MYSDDVKRIAMRLYLKFASLRIVSKLIDCSYSTISRWKNFKKIERKKIIKKLDSSEISDFINIYIIAHPICTVEDVKNIILETFKITVSLEFVRKYILGLGFTRKKARYYSETKNYQEKLNNFLNIREQYVKEKRKFVSIDETSFGRNCVVTHGRSKKGERLYIKNSKQERNESVLSAVSIGDKIKTTKKYGSYDTESFCNFLNSLDYPNKTVIIMDNVSFHHTKKVKEIVNVKEWDILYTVPYCPIFNPIEGVFSIVKRCYKKIKSIEKSFESVTSDHIKSFFKMSFNAISRV